MPGYSVWLRATLAPHNSSLQVSGGLKNSSGASKVLVQLVIRVQSAFVYIIGDSVGVQKNDQVFPHNAPTAPA